VGRDLHDSLGGKLAGAALLSQALAQSLATKSPADAAVAEEVVQCVNQAMAQTRSIAQGLCPVEVGRFGLTSGLQELAADTRRMFGVRCQFRATEGLAIGDDLVAAHLFRIAQEAVNNALRHGQARHIRIELSRRGGGLCLEIRDDGCGLPEPLPAGSGMGLRTMRYRAGVIGARLAVKRRRPHGTVVVCDLFENVKGKHPA
jgi:two-component system, LuxR family, sensor kinase FixL